MPPTFIPRPPPSFKAGVWERKGEEAVLLLAGLLSDRSPLPGESSFTQAIVQAEGLPRGPLRTATAKLMNINNQGKDRAFPRVLEQGISCCGSLGPPRGCLQTAVLLMGTSQSLPEASFQRGKENHTIRMCALGPQALELMEGLRSGHARQFLETAVVSVIRCN